MSSHKARQKRKREEKSISSFESCSPITQTRRNCKKIDMEQWKDGAYIFEYLTLLNEIVSGNLRLDGKLYTMNFWNSFRVELTSRVRNAMPHSDRVAFRGFSTTDVVNYGEYLRDTYHKFKARPQDLEDFALYKAAFERCGRCTMLPSFPKTLCGSKRSSGAYSDYCSKRSKSVGSTSGF